MCAVLVASGIPGRSYHPVNKTLMMMMMLVVVTHLQDSGVSSGIVSVSLIFFIFLRETLGPAFI